MEADLMVKNRHRRAFITVLCISLVFVSPAISLLDSSVKWAEWSSCSTSCGLGKQTRSKVCILSSCQPAVLVGTEFRHCNHSACSDPLTTNHYFSLSPRGCRYSGLRVLQTRHVATIFGCTSMCSRNINCTAVNVDSDGSQHYQRYTCEIVASDDGIVRNYPQVSEGCLNYVKIIAST